MSLTDNVNTTWAELIALLFLIAGLFVSFMNTNPYILYFMCLIVGLILGRIYYRFKNRAIFTLVIITGGFFAGLLLSVVYADLKIVTISIALGGFLGYWLHEKGIIRSIEH
jgi:hypothetical protein